MRWINASDLEQWADRREAQDQFPLVIRRLVNFTAQGLRRADFRTGEGVQLGGWDGIVESDAGSLFVPQGTSAWELGTGKSPKVKANDDYQNRTDDPKGLDPASTSYTALSLRRWSDKREWENEKKREGAWLDVRALDADDLEAWLDLAPPVEAWLARKLGKLIENAESLDDYWQDLSASTTPPLVPALLLKTRERALEKLLGWLQGPPSPLVIRANSTDEAIAFVAVAVETLDESLRAKWKSRGVVVEDTRYWRQVAASPSGGSLIVATGGDTIATARLIQDRNHVILTGSLGTRNVETIELPRLSTYEFASALEEMGLSRGPAARLAQESGRSFAALRTHLGPVDQQPSWISLAPALVPALLAAGWDEAKEADKETVSEIAGIGYSQFRLVLNQIITLTDSPLRKAGTVWKLLAPADAWRRLGGFVDDEVLKRFRSAFLKVMQLDDPRLDLPVEDRWAAGLHGKVSPYSGVLRESLVESLARLAVAQPEDVPQISGNPQAFANAVVSELLDGADERHWSSVSPALPKLAEAAPDVFLRSVERALATEPPVLLALFKEEGPFPFRSSKHTYLLWALERLSWSPAYLIRAALALARLAELDPGGRTTNRPVESLREIFLPWARHTSADFSTRLELLRQLLARYPGIGFPLLLKLLPQDFETASAPTPPQFREWDYGADEPVMTQDYVAFVEAVGAELLKAATAQGLWPGIIKHVSSFSPDQRMQIREGIRSWAPEAAPDRVYEAWSTLRELIVHHKQFPQTDQTFSVEELQKYSQLLDELEPLDPSARFGWLFESPWVEIPEERTEDLHAYDEAVFRYRRKGVLDTLEFGGLKALLELARSCGAPAVLGRSAAAVLNDPDGKALLDASLGKREARLREFGLGFVSEMALQRGFEWVLEEVERGRSAGWSTESVTDILCATRPGMETWEKVRELGSAHWDWYWENTPTWSLNEPEEVRIAVTELMRARRPGEAARLLWLKPESIPAQLVMDCLEQLVSVPVAEREVALARHAIPSLFERLQKNPDADTARLAHLEWIYLEIFGHGRRLPATLHQLLNESPEFFVELVTLCFRARPRTEPIEDEAEGDDPERALRVEKAWRLLRKWQGIPGRSEDGTIHEENLAKWISSVRESLRLVNRSAAGEQMIGQMLAHSAEGTDGAWPAEPIRNLIEQLSSDEIEKGINVGLHSRRGAQWRRQGGDQERELADRFQKWSEVVNVRWPRTAALLRRIAEGYRSEARSWDRQTELDSL